MTWPQMLRREVTITIQLGALQHAIVTRLLMAEPGEFVSTKELIEFVYPDAELSPQYELDCLRDNVLRLRIKGFKIISKPQWGYRLAGEPDNAR